MLTELCCAHQKHNESNTNGTRYVSLGLCFVFLVKTLMMESCAFDLCCQEANEQEP